MNQQQWYKRRRQQQNVQPSLQHQSIPRHKKSKQKISNVASKSFSESFLSGYNYRQPNNSNKNKKDDNVTQSMDTKNKKLSDFNILNQNKNDRKKVFSSAFDSKILKEAIKAKSQSHRVHASYSSNFKYKNIQKPKQSKSNIFLQLNQHTKNKSEADINNMDSSHFQYDKRLLKSISQTTKKEEFNNRVIKHLQGNNKSTSNNQSSFSESKKVSQKIQAKLNGLQSSKLQQSHFHEELNRNMDPKSSHGNLIKMTFNQEKLQSHENEHDQQRLQYQYAFRTRKGKNVSNPNKVNQDSILVKQNISKKDLHMIAVADGHGPSGHFVSQFVVKYLSKLFSEEINEAIKFSHKDNKTPSNLILEGTLFLPKIYDKIQTALTCSEINAVNSGSTLVNVIIQRNEILCANVGDSRAILARQLDKKNWELIYLSEDHKPSNETERKRILKNGGRIHSFKGEKGQSLGPLRVWLPNQNIQGLAMTRSFGDNVSKSVGVTHKPEMIKVKIDQKDKFILVASDGVWQFISNQEILQLIAPFYKEKKLEEACDALLKFAYGKWTQGDDSVVDDISFVLVFLHC